MQIFKTNNEDKDFTQNTKTKLLNSKIFIAGNDSLSTVVFSNLIFSGIGTFGTTNKKVLELTDSNEHTKNFKPCIKIETCEIKPENPILDEILQNYDILVDCYDDYKSKFILNKYAVKYNKILVHGGITGFYGQVTSIFPGETPCLECLFPDPDFKLSRPIKKYNSIVNIIGALEAQTVLNIILENGNTLKNELLTYDAEDMDLKRIKLTKNSDCKICFKQQKGHLKRCP